MECSLVKITQLYEQYKTSPNTIEKMEYYINTQLPGLLKKYNEQEKKRIFLEKQSIQYINEFLTNPDTSEHNCETFPNGG